MRGREVENYHYIAWIECQWVRCAFWTTPERLSGASHGVLRQTEQKLADVVVVVTLKLKPGPNNAFLERQRFVGHKVGNNLFDLFFLLSRIFERAFQIIRLREVGVDGLSRFHKEVIKLCPTPLQKNRMRLESITRECHASIVWLIALGKFLIVHEGVSFSGGSWDDAYDSVRWGTTTCVFPFVPSVPDSNKGFL